MKHVKTCAYVSSGRVLYRDSDRDRHRHDVPIDFDLLIVDTGQSYLLE